MGVPVFSVAIKDVGTWPGAVPPAVMITRLFKRRSQVISALCGCRRSRHTQQRFPGGQYCCVGHGSDNQPSLQWYSAPRPRTGGSPLLRVWQGSCPVVPSCCGSAVFPPPWPYGVALQLSSWASGRSPSRVPSPQLGDE